MLEIGIFFIVTVGIIVVGFTLLQLGHSSSKTSSPGTFANTDFIPTQMYLDNTGFAGIALNESSKTICVIQSPTHPPQLFYFTDLIATFVIQNEAIIQKTLRTFPKEIAAVAKEVQDKIGTGKVEAVDSSPPEDQIQKIDLYVVIKDQECPIHIINFFNMKTKDNGIIYNKAMVSVKHWHHLLSDLIQVLNGANEASEPTDNSSANSPAQTLSVADELIKLNELLHNNVISQSDFDTQKEKLLAPH